MKTKITYIKRLIDIGKYSLMLVIPKRIIELLKLKKNEEVIINYTIGEDKLIISKLENDKA
jgi:hypothetical protein